MWLQRDSHSRGKTCLYVCDTLDVVTALVVLLQGEHDHTFPHRPGLTEFHPMASVGRLAQSELVDRQPQADCPVDLRYVAFV